MNQEVLESLGLSPNEARIYLALLEHGESSIGAISVFAKVHRRNAHDAMNRLVNKGLSFQIFSEGENTYSAVDPDKLVELYAERAQKLQKILPDLKQKFGKRTITEEAYIYHGHEGQKNIWREIVRVGADIYNIGAKLQWLDPKLEPTASNFFKEVNRKKIKIHLLFDHEVKEREPDFHKSYPGLHIHSRFLPKKYSTSSIINIFGDYVVTYTGAEIRKMAEDTVFFVLRSKELAESYRKWFRYMWDQSSEPKESPKLKQNKLV